MIEQLQLRISLLEVRYVILCLSVSPAPEASRPLAIKRECLISFLQVGMFVEEPLHGRIIGKDLRAALPIFFDREVMLG